MPEPVLQYRLDLYRFSVTPFAHEKLECCFSEAVDLAEARMLETHATQARLIGDKDNKVVWRKFGDRSS